MLFGVILKSNTGIYRLVLIRYNEKRMRYEQAFIYGNSKKIIQAIYKCKPILINATIQSGDKIYFRKYKNLMSQIESIAKIVRRVFEDRIGTGTDLCGYCIWASELLLGIYVSLGYMGRTVEGWCEFDDEYYGSDRPYDEHTWLELFVNNKKLYIDKNTAKPIKMEIEDINQKVLVYILYNEIKINSINKGEILALK